MHQLNRIASTSPYHRPIIDLPLLQPSAFPRQIMPRRCRSTDARASPRSGRKVPAPLSPPKNVQRSSRFADSSKKQQKLRPLGLLGEHCGPTKPTTKWPHARSQYYHRKGVAMTASNDLFPFKFIANTQLASLHYWHLLPKIQHQQLHLQSMYVLAARTRTHSKGMGSKQQGMGNLASNE